MTKARMMAARPLGGRARWGAAALLGALWALAAGCPTREAGDVSRRTVAECADGACRCVFTADCPGALACVDGVCVAAVAPPVDARDGQDGADAPDAPDAPGPEDGGGGDGVADGEVEGDGSVAADGGGEDAGPDAAEPAGFAAFCERNTDCASGWCVDAASGGYCSQACSEGCPDGWLCKAVGGITDPVELCVRDESRLCQACEVDEQCGAASLNRCLAIGGGSFCGRECESGPCPEGYRCDVVELSEGGTSSQCVPQNGTCDCTPLSAGLVKTCTATNSFGTCVGSAICDPSVGFVDCTARTPEAEGCNGVDDDCDGQTDEGQAPTACQKENAFGVCLGTETCQGSAGRVCTAREPAAELCNGADDDCDGQTDEDFVDAGGVYFGVDHCGACGQRCADKFDHAAEVACDVSGEAPACRLVSCAEGYLLFNGTTCVSEDATLCNPCGSDAECFGAGSRCLPTSPTDPRTFCGRDCSGLIGVAGECPASYSCNAAPGGTAQCQPLSASCDCTAANAGQVKACARESALGTCFGQERCEPALGWTGCTAPEPAAEACNGRDDDCDGLVDEEQAVGAACTRTNAFGACAGVTLCAGEAGVVCTALEPAAEVCNGVDDDCDGATDEGFATSAGGGLKYGLSVEHCGACGYACPAVEHGQVACDPSPAIPQCVVAACAQGYYPHLGAACLPVPTAGSCAPCSGAGDCAGPADLCVDDGESAFCARDCGAGAIYDTPGAPCTGAIGEQGCCPDGYRCEDGGAGARVCRPDSGSCRCLEDGAVSACSRTSAFGTCLGTETCELDGAAPGLTACTARVPAAETCNGVDDDCDGRFDAADDGLDPQSTPNGLATCATGPGCSGTWSCAGGAWACSAPTPSAEVCDGRDNDCDGAVDDGFRSATNGLYLSPQHCGGCGFDCALLIPHSTATSCALVGETPTCLATACAAGYFPFDGGRTCLALPDNLCQGCAADSDCLVPSSRCVVKPGESFCARSCAAGSPYGASCPAGYSCQPGPGGASLCQPTGGTCQCGPAELGQKRACSVGACTGLETCTAQAGGSYGYAGCSAVGLIPEVCDGADNDCNGQTDEGFLVGGSYGTDEHCGVCGNDCTLRWDAAADHALGACSGGVAPTCVISACTTTSVAGATWEWVDTNARPGDGCECLRLQGNTAADPPDQDFGGPPTAATSYVDANCDGVDGVVAHALFVSAGNPQAGTGTLANPYRSIGQALAAWPTAGKSYILVAGGDYEENLVLTAGVKLHGGYAPDFKSRNIVTFETRVLGREPDFLGSTVIPGTVHASGITAATVFSGFVVRGYDVTAVPPSAGAAGFSTYAVYLLDCGPGLVLANNRVVGGIGGAGAPGASGANGYGAGSSGGAALSGGAGLSAEDSGSACTAAGDCPAGTARAGGAAGVNAQCPSGNGSIV